MDNINFKQEYVFKNNCKNYTGPSSSKIDIKNKNTGISSKLLFEDEVDDKIASRIIEDGIVQSFKTEPIRSEVKQEFIDILNNEMSYTKSMPECEVIKSRIMFESDAIHQDIGENYVNKDKLVMPAKNKQLLCKVEDQCNINFKVETIDFYKKDLNTNVLGSEIANPCIKSEIDECYLKKFYLNNVDNYIKKEPEIIDDKNKNNSINEDSLQIAQKDIYCNINIKTEVLCEDKDDLYRDHIIDGDLIIGPETIQSINSSVSEDVTEESRNCNTLSQYCKKCDIHFDEPRKKHECLVCEYCNEFFNTQIKLDAHLLKHKSDNGENSCHICGKQFTAVANLHRHLVIHSGVKAHKCEFCDLTFSRSDYLRFHISKHHTNMMPHQERARSKPKPATCELCYKVLSTKNSCNTHMKFSCPMNKNKVKKSKDVLYTCYTCNSQYPYRSSLQAHIQRKHMIRKVLKYECAYCGKIYYKKHNLQCHIQAQHLNMKPYKCDLCKETFNWNSCLATHLRQIHGKCKK